MADIPNNIPEIPAEVFDAGWTRDEVNYPSYKDFLSTAEPDKVYDFYVDYLIEGERHTYFFRRDTLDNLIDNYDTLIDELNGKVTDMANESGEELGFLPDVRIDFVWRAINPIEVEVKE